MDPATNATHSEIREMLAEAVFGTLGLTDQDRVDSHIAQCDSCAAEFASRSEVHRIAAATTEAPPPHLRSTVLAAAFATRAPTVAEVPGCVSAWEAEIGRFLELVHTPELYQQRNDHSALSLWKRPCIAEYGLTVRDVVCHLIASESRWAGELGAGGLTPETDVNLEVRTRAVVERHRALSIDESITELEDVVAAVRSVLRGLSEADLAADSGMVPGFSIETYLTFRSLETWIHADDIRLAIGHDECLPEAVHVATMTTIFPQWIPVVVNLTEPDAPGRHYRLELTGRGASTYDAWTGSAMLADSDGEPDVVITCDAVGLCKLAADRRDRTGFEFQTIGQADLATSLINKLPDFAMM